MTTLAARLPGEPAGLLDAMDLSRVCANQRWVLAVMRKDGPALIRLLWRMLGHEQDVLDAYQECFCKLIAMADRFEQAPARGYAFRIAMNIALDAGRRRKVRRDHFAALTEAARRKASERSGAGTTSAALIEELRAAIEGLPPRLRDVIVLRDLAELSYRDVARMLGLTSGTARVYRREAIVALARRMRATDEE